MFDDGMGLGTGFGPTGFFLIHRIVVKINPLIHWTTDQVWDKIHTHNLPYNPLNNEGYRNIGCIPCTSKVTGSDPERAGRWKEVDKTECRIHLPKHGMSRR
jgi:phosphoadenosine phosphosulfate reductase